MSVFGRAQGGGNILVINGRPRGRLLHVTVNRGDTWVLTMADGSSYHLDVSRDMALRANRVHLWMWGDSGSEGLVLFQDERVKPPQGPRRGLAALSIRSEAGSAHSVSELSRA